MLGSVESHPLTVWRATSFAQKGVGRTERLDRAVQRLLVALLPAERQGVARCASHEPDRAGPDPVVDHLGEALAERAEVLPDDGQVVLTGDERPLLTGETDPTRRIRGVRDPCLLGFQDGVGDVRALVGIADDEAGAGLDQEPDVAGGDRRIRVPLGVGEEHLADLRVGERLEDGLHAGHLTPDVEPATIGVPHDDAATGAGVALRRVPALDRLGDGRWVEILVGASDRGQDDVRHTRDRSHRLLHQGRVGVGALAVLRQRPGGPGGPGGPRCATAGACGRARRSAVTAATACRRHQCERHDDADDLDPFHVPLLLGRWRSPSLIARTR